MRNYGIIKKDYKYLKVKKMVIWTVAKEIQNIKETLQKLTQFVELMFYFAYEAINPKLLSKLLS